MKHTAHREPLRTHRPHSKRRGKIDYMTALGSLSVALFAYIVYHVIYPLLSKGLLW